MSNPRLNFTHHFHVQKRAISTAPGVDYDYIRAAISNMIAQIRADAKGNLLQERYTAYLYGVNFVTYLGHVKRAVAIVLSENAIADYAIEYESIGTDVELTTYPDLRGIRVILKTK